MAERLSIDDLIEAIDAEIGRAGKSGGGGGKKKREPWGSKGRKGHKGAESRVGQKTNAAERRENDQKSPGKEVGEVLRYISITDEGNPLMPAGTRYIKWLEMYINNPDSIQVLNEECGKWEQYTASVHAGGSGKQTSRPARARTHLITGIRESAEQSRQAGPNQEIVMEKIKAKLITHVLNWRKLMLLGEREVITKQALESAVLGRMTEI